MALPAAKAELITLPTCVPTPSTRPQADRQASSLPMVLPAEDFLPDCLPAARNSDGSLPPPVSWLIHPSPPQKQNVSRDEHSLDMGRLLITHRTLTLLPRRAPGFHSGVHSTQLSCQPVLLIPLATMPDPGMDTRPT